MRRGLAAALVLAIAAAAAGDDEAPYFARPLRGSALTPSAIAAAADGSVYLAGTTRAADLPGGLEPIPEAGNVAFVTAFAPGGAARWTRYLTLAPGADVRALAVGEDGAVWLTATQGGVALFEGGPEEGEGARFPVFKLDADGAVAFVQEIGGTRQDTPYGLVVMPDGDAVVAGMTGSRDFPVASAFQTEHAGGKLDGFVTRVLGDGGGIAWSTYLGTPADDGVTALALDGAGDLLVVHHARAPDGGSYARIEGADSITALDVVRIGADGTRGASVPLPHGTSGAVFRLAVGPDGSILAGGQAGYPASGGAWNVLRGFVARIAPGAASAEAIWRRDGAHVTSLGVTPAGDVVVGTHRDTWPAPFDAVRVLTPDLSQETMLLPEDARRPIDVSCVAPDGAACYAARGLAVLFPAGPRTFGDRDVHVGRIPARGIAPPAAVRVARSRERSVDLRWRPADPVVRYEVQRVEDGDDGFLVEGAGEAPASARSLTIRGLRPGETQAFRLLAVFASGVRAAVDVPEASTRPVSFENVTARPDGVRGARVSWERGGNGEECVFQIERALGSGPYERLRRSAFDGFPSARSSFFDAVPMVGGVPVRYRVRAVSPGSRVAGPWATASLEAPAATLRVRQTRGETSPVEGGFRFIIDGTIDRTDAPAGAPAFDPERDDFVLVAGDPSLPVYARVAAGQWQRKSDGSLFRIVWPVNPSACESGTGSYTEYAWWLTVDPARGTFHVIAFACAPLGIRPGNTQMFVGVSCGGRSGGDLRAWTRVPGAPPGLVLR